MFANAIDIPAIREMKQPTVVNLKLSREIVQK
jgi:hypothetical protein